MKLFNRFDMEQQIMTCWNVCEDMETLCEGVLDRDMTRDQIANVLLGMKDLYQLKFETLFEQFESMLKDRRSTENGWSTGRDEWPDLEPETEENDDVAVEDEWEYETTISVDNEDDNYVWLSSDNMNMEGKKVANSTWPFELATKP